MTPHERAMLVLRERFGTTDGYEILGGLITTAIQAQSNEDELRHRERQAALRDLLAQQAQRAEDLIAQVERYNEMAGRDADELASLRAQVAVLREAAQAALDSSAARNGSPCNCGACNKIRAALAATPEEALESIQRKAKIEALEALPCDSVGGDCINQSKGVEPWWCLRCKALSELKGGK